MTADPSRLALRFVDNSYGEDYIGLAEVAPDQNQKLPGFLMKSMYEPAALNDVVRRIDSLNAGSQHLWGKMGVAQMLAHCSMTVEAATGRRIARRLLIGRLIGPFFKKRYYDDSEFSRNSPTHPAFVVADEREFAQEKQRLLHLAREFSEGGEAKCTIQPHSFFGNLTPGEWGIGVYKHLDHHLRQFGA